MHGKFAKDHRTKGHRKETCISIATIYLADLIIKGGLTVDDEEVKTVEDIEELITGKKSRVSKCKQRVDDLFGLLKTVVEPKKKRAADKELSATKTKKQKKNPTKKRSATDKSKKAKKAKKTE